MSITNLTKIIRVALFTPTRRGWGLPILFWGKPGIGKSTVIRSIAASHGFPCEVLSPGERGEGAFGVTPMPDSDGFISYPPPRWVEQFTDETGGVVFPDEINTAPPAIQAPIMGLMLDGRIGGHVLHPRVRTMAAANDVQDAAGGWDLAPPLANRMGHLPWEPPSESEWTDWLLSDVDELPTFTEAALSIEKRVTDGWAPHWARARGLVGGFVRAKPHALHKQPAMGSPEASKAWPSPRSWEFATRALASAASHGLNEADADMFAAAFVGPGVMSELVTYRTEADLPDPVAVLSGQVKWKPDFKRLDRTFAVLGSTTSIMMSEVAQAGGAEKAKKVDKVMKHWEVYMGLCSEVSNGAVDLCWSAAKAVAKAGMHSATDQSKALMRKLLPMINAVEGK